MAEQLTFNLPVRPSLARGDFFLSEANALAMARLERPQDWPLNKLILVGPEGAGKSHLANVWAEMQGARLMLPEALASLDIGAVDRAVALDNADRLDATAETPLFHLHNRLASLGLPLLLTAATAPSRWTIHLPDLQSRMEATDVVRIEPPDDALLAAVLVKQFADRQLDVSPRVISWLVRRMDRSFAEAQRIVAALDRVALSEGRAITQPLARRILDKA